MKRELKLSMAAKADFIGPPIAEPIPMKRELKRRDKGRILWKIFPKIAEPIPMKRELKLQPCPSG